ncbi:MAG: DUF2628 domain-containing protein [Methyloceanibacter sp.]
MTLYSVYEPPAEAPDLVDRAEALTFVKEGFAWPALLVPGLWLLYQRMWLELIVFILIFALLAWAFGSSDEGQALLGWISLALVVLFAFEANDLRGAALVRSGYRLTGVAIGNYLDAAELAFLRTWLPQQQKEAGEGEREQEWLRGAKAPARQMSAAMRGSEGEEVIGLFPRP